MAASNIAQLANSIYRKLGHPPSGIVSLGDLVDELYDRTEFYLNRLNLSDANWLIRRKIITVDGVHDEYVQAEPYIGRPLLLETFDETGADLMFVRRDVPLVAEQDIKSYWKGANIVGITTASPYKHSAQCVAVIRDTDQGNQIVLRFCPPPVESASYRLYYEPLIATPPTLQDHTDFLPNFEHMLTTEVAIALLPKCVNSYGPEFYSELKGQLTSDLPRFEVQWERWIANLKVETAGMMRDFLDFYR